MKDNRFGKTGEKPTEFERSLLDASNNIDDVWVLLGKRIGADALFAVLDEVPGMILSVPSRAGFVKRLYLPQRDQEILALSKTHTDRQLTEKFHLTDEGVRQARKRALRTRPAPG